MHLKFFAKKLEMELGAKIKRIRTDGGSEYKRFVDAYLKEEGIQHEITAPYHPDQNSVVERANRTIMGRVRAIIEDAKFPRELWDEVATTRRISQESQPHVSTRQSHTSRSLAQDQAQPPTSQDSRLYCICLCTRRKAN